MIIKKNENFVFLDWYRKHVLTKNVEKTEDEFNSAFQFKILYAVDEQSIIKELLIHNKIQFTTHTESDNRLELLDQQAYLSTFDKLLKRKYYSNFADIVLDDESKFTIRVFNDEYFEFCQKLALKISEFTDVTILYCGPIMYYLRLDKKRRNKVFNIYDKKAVSIV